ncbi:ABC transporter substrate-binding protein [Candidimonas sp. SYP-B2681]|uniref:ABC transporter substrate-binding protein n=1 Tax=Candidimonas sp. SYP-B2681 TaxID=2497686 RepID=UPI000F89490C|nr:ABC transporter substrate-binding protein [Candidimonas sp. SYP-B2681]RTZ44544.1 ABC transporter substrate-binding protein [Candidimonas sp. SYP-B2681]
MTDKKVAAPGRRLLLQGSAAMAAGLVMPSLARAQTAGPIRIGHLTPRTGFLGPMGEYAVLGATLAVEEVNAAGGALGRKLELLTEDSVNPQTASTKAQRMVERDKVNAIVGEISSASGLAIAQVATRAKTLFLQTGCNSDELRGKSCSRYMFHLEACNTMYVRTIGRALLRDGMVKGKKWMAFTADYAFGHDLFKQTKKFMDEHGAIFVSNDMLPTDATEFSASLLKIRQQKPDLVMSNLAGNQTTNFAKQYKEFDIGIPFAGADMNMTSIWGAGSAGFSGTWPIIWTHQVQAPSAVEFVSRFQKRWNKLPENQAVNDYLAIKILADAMNKTQSDDVQKIIAYLESDIKFDVLRDRQGYFRPWDHQLMYEMYTVTPNSDKGTGKQDFMTTSKPVPAVSESLEVLAPTQQENMCTFA